MQASDEELFYRLLALDHSRQAPWGPLHGVAVACYLLQHADGPVAADDPNFEIIAAFLEGGLPALSALTDRRRRRNSHRAAGAPLSAPSRGPLLPGPPQVFETTISDVAVDGTFPAEGYEERIRLWAVATVRSWTDSDHLGR